MWHWVSSSKFFDWQLKPELTNLKQKKEEKKENPDWWSNLAPIQVNETLSFKHDQAPFVLYTKYTGRSIFVQGGLPEDKVKFKISLDHKT